MRSNARLVCRTILVCRVGISLQLERFFGAAPGRNEIRSIIQRVSSARVEVAGDCIGQIQCGIVALIGVAPQDNEEKIEKLLQRIFGYRIFPDDQGRMNLNVQQIGGSVLFVPNFTLMADTRKGMRPGFSTAADSALAERLFLQLRARAQLIDPHCAFGRFGADMQVSLCNDGPITLSLEV